MVAASICNQRIARNHRRSGYTAIVTDTAYYVRRARWAGERRKMSAAPSASPSPSSARPARSLVCLPKLIIGYFNCSSVRISSFFFSSFLGFAFLRLHLHPSPPRHRRRAYCKQQRRGREINFLRFRRRPPCPSWPRMPSALHSLPAPTERIASFLFLGAPLRRRNRVFKAL